LAKSTISTAHLPPPRDNHHRSKRRATDTGEDANYDTDYESDDRLEWLEEQQRRKREEEEFQQRLWDELGQQERLDNLTSNLNSYTHIPQRWKSGGTADLEDAVYNDPNSMDDERYAEWMREGMWKYVTFVVCECCFPSREALARKRNAQAYQEQLRKKAEEEARKKRAEQLASERLAGRLVRPTNEGDANGLGNAEQNRTLAMTMRHAGTHFYPPTNHRAVPHVPDIPWPCHAAYSTFR
jgi:hypothetical protein